MKTVALVPIKLNSQRLPHKNILPLAGKPLCQYIISSLLQVEHIDEVYVYCSDESITKYLPEGAIFMKRDSRLDFDTVKGFQIYRTFIQAVEADIYVLAHTTSPFVQATTIKRALAHVISGEHDSAFSAARIQTFAWYDGKPINYDLHDVPRTQDMEPIWVETSGFYIFKKEIFVVHNRRIGFRPYIAEVSGMEALDIDEPNDYEIACKLAGEKPKSKWSHEDKEKDE